MKPDNTRLIDLKSVRLTVIILLLLSFLSAVVISLNSDLAMDLSYEGFNFFTIVYSVPLKIAAAIVPIVGFIALYHRSEQTQKQITLSYEQNIFSNYYAHTDKFHEYAKSSQTTKITQFNLLYEFMYPRANEANFELDKRFINLLDSIITGDLKIVADTYEQTQEIQNSVIPSMYARINLLFRMFGVSDEVMMALVESENQKLSQIPMQQIINSAYYIKFRPVLCCYEYMILNLDKQARFDHHYTSSRRVREFIRLSGFWGIQNTIREGSQILTPQQVTPRNYDPSYWFHRYLDGCIKLEPSQEH